VYEGAASPAQLAVSLDARHLLEHRNHQQPGHAGGVRGPHREQQEPVRDTPAGVGNPLETLIHSQPHQELALRERQGPLQLGHHKESQGTEGQERRDSPTQLQVELLTSLQLFLGLDPHGVRCPQQVLLDHGRPGSGNFESECPWAQNDPRGAGCLQAGGGRVG